MRGRGSFFALAIALVVAQWGCAEGKCKFNSDCPAGTCVDGECSRECFAEVDCPTERPVCTNGVCKARPGSDASIDTTPIDGALPESGGPDTTEPPTDSTVAIDTSAPDTFTPIDTSGPKKGQLTKCSADGECTSGKCSPSSPRFCTKTCASHGECPHGQLCAGGLCRIDDTGATGCDLATAAPCLEFCYGTTSAKHCTHTCSNASECPSGYACSPVAAGKKICVEIEKGCTDPTQCASALGFCNAGGVGCSAKCDSASDCPHRLVGLPPYTCELRSGVNVCIPPADVLGSDPLGATCSAIGTNKCRSGACDEGTTPASCNQRCTTRGGCPNGFGCFPLEDLGPPKSTLLVCTVAGSSWLGDTCTRARDCITGLCQAPGYCTRLCADGLCPDGMTCVASGLTATDGTPIKLCTK